MDHNQKLPQISRRRLSLCNGVDRKEVWIAYQGKVYDVGGSRLWFTGKHYEHWAGQDLTHELKDAPHTEAVFQRVKLVGILED